MSDYLQSGLDPASQCVPGETPEQFAQLRDEYFARFRPATPEQRFQVDNLIRNEWQLRRLFRVEAELWAYQTAQADPAAGVQLGEAFAKASTIFQRLQRRIASVEKAYKEAMDELTRLQTLAQPPQTEEDPAELASFLTTAAASPLLQSDCPISDTVARKRTAPAPAGRLE